MVSTRVNIPGYRISEELYNGSRTLVYRGYRETDSLRVVIKLLKNPYPGFSELVQFRNQYTIAKNLNSPLIIQTYRLEPYQNGYALVMEDFGGISLKEWGIGSSLRNLTGFLQIAIALCNILDILYRDRIIHKDIKPANILINPETKQIKLIDFSIASLLPRETQTLISPNVLEGTLAYISPEQTGRMNRGIDYRTDFYSLGVTFYELLTGELPFQSNDMMELVHCHIAKLPPNMNQPHPTPLLSKERVPKAGEVSFHIPQVLCDIVMKLMAKNAEERYQSALGLKYDLENCLTQLQSTGKIESFPIAQTDVCDRFIIPDKLYGRETEVKTLLQAFERVSKGATEMILVAGFSGIGKTAVVNEVHQPIVRQRGYFIKGKYDQFQQNIPFSAFVQAFRDLMGQLLTESDAQTQEWKSKLLKAVGENGQVIIEVIPELKRIIGIQPPAPELSGTAAQNRFNSLFQKFTQVFTITEHPLVIFLDDLQWADSASLKLIQLLMTDTGHLLIIGAYRDNEVNPVHPLMLTLSEIEKALFMINTITLAPLSQVQVNYLVADTLKCSENLALPLSLLVSQKTQGNPFFATQFLKALHQDKLIEFSFELGCWECDITRVTQQAVTDDVVAFMAFQLRRLPSSTQNILQLAACIGNQFDLGTLAIVWEKSEIETAACLWKALQEGLILPTDNIYKFYVGQDSLAVTQEIYQTVKYNFLHDRVQQAAYSLIPDEQKKTTHHRIGQQLLKNTSESEQEERIFQIVNQINVAVELIEQPTAREELAKLNLIAGRKAKNSTAYNAAVKYFAVGRNLLAGDRWQSQYNLTLNLYVEAVEAAYLNTDIDEMEQLVEVVLQQAKTALDTVKVYGVRINVYTSQGQLLEAINTGLTILKQFEIDLPESPDLEDVARASQQTQALLGSKKPTDLLNLPEMTNPQILSVMQILNEILVPAYLTKPNLNSLIIMTQMNLSMIYGNAPLSALGYSSYGLFLCAVAGDIEQGYEFGQLALNLLSKFKEKKIEARVLFVTSTFIIHWKIHVRETLKLLQNAYSSGWESGNLMVLGYAAYAYGFHAYFMGYELSELEQEMTAYSKVLEQINQQTQLNYNELYRQSILNLLGQTASPFLLLGEADKEQELLARYQQIDDKTGLWHFFLNKLILCYFFQEFEAALEYIERAKHYASAGKGMFNIPVFYFYASLTCLTVLPNHPKFEQENILQQVAANQKKMQEWTSYNPTNHLHKFYLVEAERHRVLGEYLEAMKNYDLAISLAKENGYIQEEGLSNELAAKFYLDWGKQKVAQAYMQEAYYCYARWGAKAKTDDLTKYYPKLLQPILQQQRINLNPLETIEFSGTFSSTYTFSTSSTNISNVLDFTSVLKASQAISSSLEIDQLITTLTRIILENSGAKKSALILPQGDTWQVKAITFINHGSNSYIEIQTIVNSQALDTCQDIPVNIINYVKNTQQTVVIDNLQTDIPGVIGEYMYRTKPQSVLCTPIINQGHLVGIIYLENKLTPGVFTSDRLSVINLLCTQAAISLENAQLYTDLQGSQARFHRLAENVPGMIYQFQLLPDGISRFNYVSTGCYEIYEIPPEQAVADASSLISAVSPEDMAHFQESVTISAQTLEPWRYEGRIITPSGKVKWIQAASRPIKQADGTIIWDGLLLDVTERKQAEAAVFQKSQELKKALEELQQAQLQIVQSEKMSALGNLVAGVAHEMNNPLGFIYASLQQAKPSLADIVEHLKLYQSSLPNPGGQIIDHAEEIDLNYSLEDLPKIIDSMVMACDRLKNISTSLRTFSRADKDYKVRFNIHEGIDSTILILKHRLKANEQRPAIEVITDYGNFPQVECFPGQLNQVFMNILANAIDALDESNTGRSFEEIKTNPNRIIIKTSLENEGVRIAIADNGKGINESAKQKIFDQLFTTKAVGKGTGLGLAIARQIVEETHSGKLSFNSVLGEGTKFFIEIPL
ncbi:ATP-binding sensor histidine kinase [Nostoc sp.]|uniref:ATP-binding sensor histidine kinase n=1 Tax=Nostoc sp. TaxID=1180 RepID=UPI002FF5A73D